MGSLDAAAADAGVAFLECDVGQSEFTPPGLVALQLVTKPLLGGPTSHLLQPWAARFIGSASPNAEPEVRTPSTQRCSARRAPHCACLGLHCSVPRPTLRTPLSPRLGSVRLEPAPITPPPLHPSHQAYVQSVTDLIGRYREHLASLPNPPPLVINTCGWVSGLGLQMLSDIVAAAAPSHLIVLEKTAGGAAPSLPLHALGVGPGYALQPTV